jgi:hypothetical protein
MHKQYLQGLKRIRNQVAALEERLSALEKENEGKVSKVGYVPLLWRIDRVWRKMDFYVKLRRKGANALGCVWLRMFVTIHASL